MKEPLQMQTRYYGTLPAQSHNVSHILIESLIERCQT